MRRSPGTDGSGERDSDHALTAQLEALQKVTDQLTSHVTDLEADLERATDRIQSLEAENASLHEKTERFEERIDDIEEHSNDLEKRTDDLEEHSNDLENRTDNLETAHTGLESQTSASIRKASTNKRRIEELQSRELEKGAHLLAETVDRHEITVRENRLEKITKDDGQTYYRLPESEDPLAGPNQRIALAHGDLLPIQQLASMDEDMLRSTTNALPSRLATKLWTARADPTVGDDPWKSGCKGVREYVKASDLKHWIRRQEPGTSDTYAKKLVSRTIDALLDLTKNRLAVSKTSERKNGLEYTERRVVLPADAEIPGESRPADSSRPETGDVSGPP